MTYVGSQRHRQEKNRVLVTVALPIVRIASSVTSRMTRNFESTFHLKGRRCAKYGN
jgi:hypothetical protein